MTQHRSKLNVYVARLKSLLILDLRIHIELICYCHYYHYAIRIIIMSISHL